MSFLSYLFPQTVLISSSPYNRLIRINEEYGKLKLLVNGSRQSGSYILGLWKKAFQRFGIPREKGVKRILILGVGGGTVFQYLSHIFPDAEIIGIDIDPVMISIAKKYFQVDTIPNVHLVCRDANVYMREQNASRVKYDLIIVDLFVGINIPDFVTDPGFIQGLKRMKSKYGGIVFNYLHEREYGEKSKELEHTLHKIFRNVDDYKIANNRFFHAK